MGRWRNRIDLRSVWPEETPTGDAFVKFREAVAERIRRSPEFLLGYWLPVSLVKEIAEAEDVDAFDAAMSKLYDLADRNNVWIATTV